MTRTGKLLVGVVTTISLSGGWAADLEFMHLGAPTADDNRVIAVEPGSDFKDCEIGCPVMICTQNHPPLIFRELRLRAIKLEFRI
jgi:hypothetical protein